MHLVINLEENAYIWSRKNGDQAPEVRIAAVENVAPNPLGDGFSHFPLLRVIPSDGERLHAQPGAF